MVTNKDILEKSFEICLRFGFLGTNKVQYKCTGIQNPQDSTLKK